MKAMPGITVISRVELLDCCGTLGELLEVKGVPMICIIKDKSLEPDPNYRFYAEECQYSLKYYIAWERINTNEIRQETTIKQIAKTVRLLS